MIVDRICIRDYVATNGFRIQRGESYLTSGEKNGVVTVFSLYWITNVPVAHFAGEIIFLGNEANDNE